MTDGVDQVKTAVYRHVATNASMPSVEEIARALRKTRSEVLAAYAELAAGRLLVLEADGETLRMAPPFSGIETQHRVEADCKEYFANCAWDGLGIAAALGSDAEVQSRCEQSLEPLTLRVVDGGLQAEPEILERWRFHTPVAASHWWDDIRYT